MCREWGRLRLRDDNADVINRTVAFCQYVNKRDLFRLQGRKFLTYLFTLNAEMTSDLHSALKSAMPLNSRWDMSVNLVCLKHCVCLYQYRKMNCQDKVKSYSEGHWYVLEVQFACTHTQNNIAHWKADIMQLCFTKNEKQIWRRSILCPWAGWNCLPEMLRTIDYSPK